MRKHFIKKITMNEKDNEDFENSTTWLICDNGYIDGDAKARDHCHITGNYGGSAERNCNINVKLNDKVPVLFYNLNSYDSHLTMQELDKFNLKINFLPNGYK